MTAHHPDRLEQLAGIVESVGSPPMIFECVNEALQDPGLSGDVAELDYVAGALVSHAGAADRVATDIARVSADKLPQIWTGWAAASAGSALNALSRRSADIGAVFRDGSKVVDQLSQDLVAALAIYLPARDRVRATGSLMSGSPSQWPAVRSGTAAAMREMARGIRAWQKASAEAAEALRAIASRATARAMDGSTLTAVDRLMLSAATDAAGQILSASDMARAGTALARWDPATRARFEALLSGAASDAERAWLVKAVASGHTMDEVAAFDAQLRPHATDAAWLLENLRPIKPTGASLGGAPLEMVDDTTCGSMVAMVSRAVFDPVYALSLAQPPSGTAAEAIHAEEQAIHAWTSTHDGPLLGTFWPPELGTYPDSLRHYLLDHSNGVDYELDWLVTEDGYGPVGRAMAGAEAGNPSVLLLGDSYPNHYVMVYGDQTGNVVVYNPAGGTVSAVDPVLLQTGDVGSVAAQSRLWGVIAPATNP